MHIRPVQAIALPAPGRRRIAAVRPRPDTAGTRPPRERRRTPRAAAPDAGFVMQLIADARDAVEIAPAEGAASGYRSMGAAAGGIAGARLSRAV